LLDINPELAPHTGATARQVGLRNKDRRIPARIKSRRKQMLIVRRPSDTPRDNMVLASQGVAARPSSIITKSRQKNFNYVIPMLRNLLLVFPQQFCVIPCSSNTANEFLKLTQAAI